MRFFWYLLHPERCKSSPLARGGGRAADGVSQKKEARKMKKISVFLCAMFVLSAHATTVNIDWLMDGATYAQTTCETGGNFTLPTPTPTKYGYHFVGWQQNDAIGSWAQSGTPTPTDPIYPTFVQFGNTVLRAIGSGNNLIADSYDPTTGKLTRRVGVKVLDGSDDFVYSTQITSMFTIANFYCLAGDDSSALSSHFKNSVTIPSYPHRDGYVVRNNRRISIGFYASGGDIEAFKQWLSDQYNAGTPVTIYYPLAEPVEENYNAQ